MMPHNTHLLAGSFTAIITPFTADGSKIDLNHLAAQVKFQADGGIKGVVPCGTTGESPTLTEAEHKTVVEKTIEFAKPLGLKVIAGSGSNNTAHAVHLHRMAHSLGADAALHVTPYYNKPSQEGLYQHYMKIADSCGLPIVLYNVPGRTNVTLTVDTIERLGKHTNIQAVKEATGNVAMASDILERTDLIVLSGDDPLTLPIGSVGGSGVISVLSNVLPQRVSTLVKTILKEDWASARAIHEEILPFARAMLSIDVNPVPVKTAMARLKRDTGALRLPLVPPGKTAIEAIDKILAQYKSIMDKKLVAAGAHS